MHMNQDTRPRRWRAAIVAGIVAVGLVAAINSEAPSRDTREWTNGTVTIRFSTPETYESCVEQNSDTIFTVGVPSNWRLLGSVRVSFITDAGPVLHEEIPVDQLDDLNLLITYPPLSTWPLQSNGIAEIHVDVAIEVFDQNGQKALFVGGDPINAPGTLGPGGQDWDVFCVEPPPTPTPTPPPGDEGCTPGYWKQPHHFDSWPAPYTPTTTFESVFGTVPGLPDTFTLLDALNLNGGGIYALGRHVVAALLNAASGSVNYPLTTTQVIAAFQQAIAPGGNIEGTKNTFDRFNNLGCPLN
jgi:hypothetical protein